MNPTQKLYDETLQQMYRDSANFDLGSEEGNKAMKSIQIFTQSRPSLPETDPTPQSPNTRWGKVKHRAASILDNETTRTVIKAGASFAGVAAVAYATIHKDHVLERQALAQANQRSI
jgi:hypothetical protein